MKTIHLFIGTLAMCLVVRGAGLGRDRLCVAAPDSEAVTREASRHFLQGVTLYAEADYRSALVEFKRAAALAPNPTVLYNIGQTQFQLRDYAGALKAFDRYLAVAGGDAHRSEVESNMRLLGTRVARLSVASVPAGAEISIDNEVVGKAPFASPLIVNIGRLKLTATLPRRSPAVRFVDVASEDSLTVTLELPELPGSEQRRVTAQPISPVVPAPPPPPPLTLRAPAPPPPPPERSWLRPTGWIIAGGAAAGAVTFGLVARKESGDLESRRQSYPASKAQLDDLARRTRTYAIIADSLAAVAVVTGILTWLSPSGGPGAGSSPTIGVGPGTVLLGGNF